MSILTEAVQGILTSITQDTTSKLTCPSAIFCDGGAILKLISPEHPLPDGEVLGLVLASPNVPREQHSGFDPADPLLPQFGTDFMDRILYITPEDHAAAPLIGETISLAGVFLRRKMDGDDSCGCCYVSTGTPIYRVRVNPDRPTDAPTFERLPDRYVVIPAKFVEGDNCQISPMTTKEYWIATHENRNMILDTPEFRHARDVHDQNRPDDCDGRRDRVLEQVRRLRAAANAMLFPDPKN